MKQAELFDEFMDYLSGASAPDIDYIKSREIVLNKLNCRSRGFCPRAGMKRIVLITAVLLALAAYPVYAITSSLLKEFKTLDGSISVKFQAQNDEYKNISDEMIREDKYLFEKYKDIIQERSNALEPGAVEIIIIRSPRGFDKKFLTHTIVKNDYIHGYDLFMRELKRESGFELLEPVSELPESFVFSKGELVYQRDWYTPEDTLEALMEEAEREGSVYAVKKINKLDKIGSVSMIYKSGKDDDYTLGIGVDHGSKDTYILPDQSAVEKLPYKGDEIISYKLYDNIGNLVRKEYCVLAKDLFFRFSFSKDIANYDAIAIIDSFLAGMAG